MELISKFSRKQIVVFAIILIAIGLFIFSSIDFIQARFVNISGTNASYDQVKDFSVAQIFVPPEAKEISYNLLKYFDIQASFKINETDFVKWAREKKWPLKEIRADSGASIYAEIPKSDPRKREPVTFSIGGVSYDHSKVTNGYYYETRDVGGPIEQFIFDRNTGYGYVVHYGH